MKKNLSVVLATRNEAENIATCLKSVKDLADEIIVIDEHSTDKTKEIAESFGAKVSLSPHEEIFHITKQKAIDKANGNWILQLDADERVSDDLREELLKIVEKPLNDNDPVAYYIPRKNFFLGRWLSKGGQYPDPVIRFFRRGKAYLPCKSVHEQMVVDGKTGYLTGHLYHYPNPTFSDYVKNSLNRYSILTANELKEKLKTAGFFRRFLTAADFLLIKPVKTFFLIYIRHRGFVDGLPGFIFAFFSGFHFILAYFKYWRITYESRARNGEK